MDQRCNLLIQDHESGRDPGDNRAYLIDAVRAQRLIIASFQDNEDAIETTVVEFDDCAGCLSGVIKFLAGAAASLTKANVDGDQDLALALLESRLAEAIDAQNAAIP